MNRCYYKTDDTHILAIWLAMEAAREALYAEATALAQHFGARDAGFFSNPLRFAGLVFDKAKADPAHWIAPDYNGLRRPRKSLRTATPALREAHAALLADWQARVPTTQVDSAPLLKALGLPDWFTLGLRGGCTMFGRDGWLYVSAAATCDAPGVVEITGSEFLVAKNGATG